MTGAVKNGQTKRDILKPVGELRKELSMAKHSEEKMATLKDAIFKDVLPLLGSPVDHIKHLTETEGKDLSQFISGLNPEQVQQFRALTKAQKNADYYQLPLPIEISFTESKLAKIVEGHNLLQGQSESFITKVLIPFTAQAAQKEPIAKNSGSKTHGEAKRAVGTDYPNTFNNACGIIESLTALSATVQETRKSVTGLLSETQKKILEKISDVKNMSYELSVEKNNYDNHNAWFKDSASKYPYAEKCTAEVKPSDWTLDNFSNLLAEVNQTIRNAEAAMLHKSQKCMKELTGRRHTMKQSVAQTKAFQDDHTKTVNLYMDVQTVLQHALNALTGLNIAVQSLEKQLNDKLQGISQESLEQIKNIVIKFEDYTTKINALVPYALLPDGQQREVRVLKAAGNQRVDLVV